MHKSIINYLVILFVCFFLSATSQPAVDSIKQSLKATPSLYGNIGTRNSFINNNRAQVFGVKLGLNYGAHVRLSIGYHQLYSSPSAFDKKLSYINEQNVLETIDSKLRLFYFSTQVEYLYHQSNKWRFSIPLQIGLGQVFYRYELNNKNKKVDASTIFVYEPAVSIEYKVLKWVGVGADIGFRFIVTDYKQISDKLNSPTYAFKVLVFYNEIYNTFLKKSFKSSRK